MRKKKLLTKRYSSPLRYPGGKACLANAVKDILHLNELSGIEYAEPFAGGAGLAIALLTDGLVSHIHLNDLDTAVFAFWSSLLEETSDLCRMISNTCVTIEEWHRQKQVFADPRNHSLLELGFATFFLNRTNRSGIIDGGVIGGQGQSGNYLIDCRFNKSDLIKRIESIASRRDQISLTRLDGSVFIREVLALNPQDCFTFIDPPYYEKGSSLYFNSLDHSGHALLANVVQRELRAPWIVTYDDVSEVNRLYQSSSVFKYRVNYSASAKQKGNEVMYYSPNLMIPVYE